MLWAAVGVGLDRDLGVVVMVAYMAYVGVGRCEIHVAQATQSSWIPIKLCTGATGVTMNE